MLGEFPQLVRVGAVVPGRRETHESYALRGRLLGRRCERGEGYEAAQRRHGCDSAAWEGLCRGDACAAWRVRLSRPVLVQPVRDLLAALGLGFCQYSPGEALAKLVRRDASVCRYARSLYFGFAKTSSQLHSRAA